MATRMKLYGRHSTGQLISTSPTSLSGDLGYIGRHGSHSRLFSSSNESIASRGLPTTPTDINVQVGVRWDSDCVSLDGTMNTKPIDSNFPHHIIRNNSSKSNPEHSEFSQLKQKRPNIYIQDHLSRNVSIVLGSEHDDNFENSSVSFSKQDSFKFSDLQSRNVSALQQKLHPRPPTTSGKEFKNSYEVFPDKNPTTAKKRSSPVRTTLNYDKVTPLSIKYFPNQHNRIDIDVPLYRGSTITEIVENLFLGTIESAYNEQLLCKLNISCVVDLSNLLPNQVPSKLKSLCPCTCSLQSSHSRAKLIIGIKDSDSTEIEPYYNEINRFIEAARLSTRAVLVHSYYGQSRAPAVTIQYLMTSQCMTLNQGYELVKQRWSTINISSSFMRELIRLDSMLYPNQEKSFQSRLNPFVTTETTVLSDNSDSEQLHVRRDSVKAWS